MARLPQPPSRLANRSQRCAPRMPARPTWSAFSRCSGRISFHKPQALSLRKRAPRRFPTRPRPLSRRASVSRALRQPRCQPRTLRSASGPRTAARARTARYRLLPVTRRLALALRVLLEQCGGRLPGLLAVCRPLGVDGAGAGFRFLASHCPGIVIVSKRVLSLLSLAVNILF